MAWTNENIEFIKEYYSKYGSVYCSKILNKTSRTINKKAKDLSLIKSDVSIKNLEYTKEKLNELVNACKSYTEVLVRLGLRAAGGNYKTIKKYVNLYEIDTSHFVINNLAGLDPANKKELSFYLVNGSKCNSTHFKKRLYAEGLKEKKCEICGQEENWKGMRITHILDHVNGNHSDNRIENLRIVCPNCNSALDTFSGRVNSSGEKGIGKVIMMENNEFSDNSLKIRKKENSKNLCSCGCNKCRESKECKKCSSIRKRKLERPNIDTLIKEVEDIGYCAVGREYGVSDNCIRKWIKNKKAP